MKQTAKKYERSPRYESPKRPCHDCGKPTTDYRCSACRRKWATKHGVTLEEIGSYGRGAA